MFKLFHSIIFVLRRRMLFIFLVKHNMRLVEIKILRIIIFLGLIEKAKIFAPTSISKGLQTQFLIDFLFRYTTTAPLMGMHALYQKIPVFPKTSYQKPVCRGHHHSQDELKRKICIWQMALFLIINFEVSVRGL